MIIHPSKGKLRFNILIVTRLTVLSLSLVILVSAVCAQTNVAGPRVGQTKPPAPPAVNTAGKGAAERLAQGGQPTAQKYFTDVALINQDGKPMHFYSDLLKDKVVVINAFFATCRESCLPMNRNLEKVQEAFSDRMGKDLFIISISVDPKTDTPARLKDYAKKLKDSPGRLFITGKKENVDWALYKLGQYVEQRDQHTNIFIVGNERTGLWKKIFGLAKANEIIKAVEGVLNDNGTADSATKR